MLLWAAVAVEDIKMNKSVVGWSVFILILTGVLYFGLNSQSSGNVIQGEVQNIVIGMKGSNYYPNTFKVKSGIPVSISLDNSVVGCFRDLTFPQLGINKYLSSSSDTLVFTPEQKGSYAFACSMNMGRGTMIVE